MHQNMSTPVSEEKFRMQVENDFDDGNRLLKTRLWNERRPFRLISLILLFLLVLFLLIGTIVFIVTSTRRSSCRQQQLEQAEAILGYKPDDHMKTWLPCVKTTTSSCACPATFVHSSSNPKHCIPNHSRCLKSCKHNPHCVCHNLADPLRCRIATRSYIDNELKGGPVERFHNPLVNYLLQHTWMDHFSRQLERLLVDIRSGERLFLSSDRQTGVVVHEKDDDYLLNERWTKVEMNTTRQYIFYTQLNPLTHTCRMSSLLEDGSVTHGPVHNCPGSPGGAPYYLGVACNDVLVLWHGTKQVKLRRPEGWTTARHYFESTPPRLPVLFDPFHRYYSLYEESMIEVKDLNGDVLAQFFTEIFRPTRFEFLDQQGTIWIANQTHMQTFRSTNDQAWLDF